MKTAAEIHNPENIEVTISMTMRVMEWDQIRSQLSRAHPSWVFAEAIDEVVGRLRKTIRADRTESAP